jgi:hypothetical protein
MGNVREVDGSSWKSLWSVDIEEVEGFDGAWFKKSLN